MTSAELIPNTVYWVTSNKLSSDAHTPLLFNTDKKWKVVVGGLMSFISTPTLEQMFGKNCFIRAVDKKLDIGIRPTGDEASLLPFILNAENPNDERAIILKNRFCCVVDSVALPSNFFDNNGGDYLIFKHDATI